MSWSTGQILTGAALRAQRGETKQALVRHQGKAISLMVCSATKKKKSHMLCIVVCLLRGPRLLALVSEWSWKMELTPDINKPVVKPAVNFYSCRKSSSTTTPLGFSLILLKNQSIMFWPQVYTKSGLYPEGHWFDPWTSIRNVGGESERASLTLPSLPCTRPLICEFSSGNTSDCCSAGKLQGGNECKVTARTWTGSFWTCWKENEIIIHS